jgi:hypothetical protein
MFHVEHSPVHPAPPAVAPLLNELVDTGVNDLNWEYLGELSQGLCVCAADAGGGAVGAGYLDADGLAGKGAPSKRGTAGLYELASNGKRVGAPSPAEDNQPIPPIADQPLGISSAERSAAAQEKHRLQQGGLARAVAPPDQILSGMKRKLRALNAAQIIDSKLNETHSSRSSLRDKPGIYAAITASEAIGEQPTTACLSAQKGNQSNGRQILGKKISLASAIECDQRSISSVTTWREEYERDQ